MPVSSTMMKWTNFLKGNRRPDMKFQEFVFDSNRE